MPNPVRYRFHPFARYSMIALSLIASIYSIFFIIVLIPRYENVTFFVKATSIVVLYIALSTLYKHLTSLNSVIISPEGIRLGFILKPAVVVSWEKLSGMEIYKSITHYWKIAYADSKGISRTFRTSLAFPGIMEILRKIQEYKPDVQMNELLRQVLLYKHSQQQ